MTSRLSVVIHSSNRRTLVERAVRCVLDQEDPVGTEVVVADDGSFDGTADHLESIFSDEVRSGRVKVERLSRCSDPAQNRNRGAERAQGAFLAFLDPEYRWLPGRLAAIAPALRRAELVLSVKGFSSETSDWLRAFLQANPALTSTAVVRRALFEEAGRFPEGYTGAFLPRRVPGQAEYELWLRCLLRLRARGDARLGKFKVLAESHVSYDPIYPPVKLPFSDRVERLRESLSLARLVREVPPSYWLELAKRLRRPV